MNIGSRIERLRKNKGLSRQELADQCPEWIDKVVVRQIETGAQVKSYVEALVHIAKALNIGVTELIGVQPSRPELVKLIEELHRIANELFVKGKDL